MEIVFHLSYSDGKIFKCDTQYLLVSKSLVGTHAPLRCARGAVECGSRKRAREMLGVRIHLISFKLPLLIEFNSFNEK